MLKETCETKIKYGCYECEQSLGPCYRQPHKFEPHDTIYLVNKGEITVKEGLRRLEGEE